MKRILVAVLISLLLVPCMGCRAAGRVASRTVPKIADDLARGVGPRSVPKPPPRTVPPVPHVPPKAPAPRIPGVYPGAVTLTRALVYANRNAPPKAVSAPADPRVEIPARIRVVVRDGMNAHAGFENGERVVVIGAPLVAFLQEASYHVAAAAVRWDASETEAQAMLNTYQTAVASGVSPGPPSVLPHEEAAASSLGEQTSKDTVLLVLSHELAHHWLGHVDRLITKAGLSRSSVDGMDLHRRLELAANRRRESDADGVAVSKMLEACGPERTQMAILTVAFSMDALEASGPAIPEYARTHPNWRSRGEAMMALVSR